MSTLPFPTPPHARPPVISRRAMLTVSAAAGLSGLAAGYVTLTRPLLKPAASADYGPISGGAAPAATHGNDLARRHLPGLAWAADAKYVIRNGRSILFFDEWHPTDDRKAIELKPFAMVFPPRDDRADAADEQALTVVGERAIVRVEGVIDDIATADPGRIVGGQVAGTVEIHGPGGLDILGSNFHFNEQDPTPLLWSDDNVAFRHGLHTGRGRGITLELFRVGVPEAFESIAVSGVRTVRLRKDVEMDLRFDDTTGGGPFASLSGDAAKDAAKQEPVTLEAKPAADPLPTRVTCDGEFKFEVWQNQATFAENVVAERATPEGGPPDSLACDTMTVVFEPESDEDKQAHAERMAKIAAGTLTEDDGFQATTGGLKVVWLVATAVKGNSVVLRSPSNEFVAELAELRYEAATGVTSLTRPDGMVVARQGLSRLDSPTVVIEPVEGGPPRLSCLGRGRLLHQDQPGRLALQAVWTESLHRLRGPDGLDLIRLTGKAQVEQPQESFVLAADRIDLWLDPKEGDAAKPDAPAGASGGRPLVAAGRMEPVHLLAENVAGNKVHLRSPELHADANKLDVTFAPPLVPAVKTAAGESRSRLTPASGRIRLVSDETPAAAMPETSTAADPAAVAAAGTPPPTPIPKEPIALVADAINVIVDRRDRDAPKPDAEAESAVRGGEVREVHTTGGVVVWQKRGEGEEPLRIDGDRLDLFNRGKDKELVHIYGKPPAQVDGRPTGEEPARVRDQGADLYGMNINLDRAENLAWVEGKGVLELPVKNSDGLLGGDDAKKPAGAEKPKGDPAGKPEAEPRLTVAWHERMRFDGNKAVFFGSVNMQRIGDTMSCEELEVRLTERFDFAAAGGRDASKPASRPEISEILCKDEVFVDGKEFDETGKHVGDRKARFGELVIDQRTGDTRARGPGEIRFWRKGEGNRAGLTADNAVRANATARREEGAWEYLYVKFDGTSEGNIRRRTTTFDRGVEVVYGPVADTRREIDPNRPERAPIEAGWMTGDRLTLTQHKATEATLASTEVLAAGNVRLDGRGFSGQADQVSYDESKGQYILKSFGKRVATIAKEGTDGKGAGEASGQEIQFYPARNHFQVTKAAGADGLQ